MKRERSLRMNDDGKEREEGQTEGLKYETAAEVFVIVHNIVARIIQEKRWNE